MINVIKEPDVTVTESELAKYKADYETTYMFYAGTPPTLNEYIARRQKSNTPSQFPVGK